jgi:hypothetical protein
LEQGTSPAGSAVKPVGLRSAPQVSAAIRRLKTWVGSPQEMPMKFPKRPKKEPTKIIRYETRVTAFLDLLGFTEYVRRTHRRGDLVGKLHELLNDLSKLGQDDYWAWSRRTTTFSDSIVLSEQIQACNIYDFLIALGRLQRRMITMELPVRGAVTVGRLYHDQGVVFGPALIKAYRLESSRAKVPRIVVDPAMVTALQEHQHAKDIVKKDADGLFFIHFLSKQVAPHTDIYLNPIEGEYRILYEMMNHYMTDTYVMQKLSWLDDYYRTHVDSFYINSIHKYVSDLRPERYRKNQ